MTDKQASKAKAARTIREPSLVDCFFNFLNFILGMAYGFAGINIMRLDPQAASPSMPLDEAPAIIQDR